MDDIDRALEQLFYALLKAGPGSQAVTWRQITAPWQQMSRRKRLIAVMTVLLTRLDEHDPGSA